MKTDTCVDEMRKIRNPYTKYEGGGRRPAPSHKDSIRATGLPKAVVDHVKPVPGAQSARVVHKINFRVLPLPGAVLMHEGQRYVSVGSDLYERRDGQIVPIILWQSHCAECGEPFECWSGLRSGTLNRRCPQHHAPGKAVAKAARKHAARHMRKRGSSKNS